MNARQTWMMVALAAGLFAYILLFERPRPDTAQAPRLSPLLAGLPVSRVNRVEFTSSNLVVHAERTDDGWRLTSPVNYPALPNAINTLMDITTKLRPRQIIPAGEIRALADFGLDPPRARLTIHSGAEETELRIGMTTPTGEQIYTQLAGQRDIDVVDLSLVRILPWRPDVWRDRTVIDPATTNFDRVKVRIGPRDMVFQRDATNQLWRITTPTPVKRVNIPHFEHVLQQLRQWTAIQFVSDDPKADLERYSLQSPMGELVFGQGTNDIVTIQFGGALPDDENQIYARILSHTNVISVRKEWLDPLRVPYWEFRDHHLVNPWPSTGISRIEIGNGGATFVLQRGSLGAWELAGPATLPADRELVQNLIEQLEDLEAVSEDRGVVTDFAEPYHLDRPTNSYSLFQTVIAPGGGVSYQPLARVDFGASPEVDRIFARRSDESSVYVVRQGDYAHLPKFAWQLRDRRIWSFSATNVLSVKIDQKGESRKLVRTGPRKWTSGNEVLGERAAAAMEEALDRLGGLQAVNWSKKGAGALSAYGFTDAAHEVTIEIAGAEKPRSLRLRFGRAPQRANPYAAIDDLDGEPLIFEFPQQLYQQVIQFLTVSTRG